MALPQTLCSYIRKLGHPLREIRERALQLVIAKLQLGCEWEDELSGTRELLEMLLAWFHVQEPTLQQEALLLLLSTIKTKAGPYIAREYGIHDILVDLYRMKHKLEPDAVDIFNDIVETLQFLNSVQSDHNIDVPQLQLPSGSSSESELAYHNVFYDSHENLQTSEEQSLSKTEVSSISSQMDPKNCFRILLFPWVQLCPSDSKTLVLVEDALRLLKSLKRCCRFIRDVFLRDFPPEVFLNRPSIVQYLLMTVGGGRYAGRPGEAIHVLLCITRALRLRLQQITSHDIIHVPNKVDNARKLSYEVQLELDEIVGDDHQPMCKEDDGIAPLRQLPAPYYALDTLHAIMSLMTQSVVFVDSCDKTEILDLNELNTCTALIEELTLFLIECVHDEFWMVEHNSKSHRDIAHKSCMVMRLISDLLNKYSTKFTEDVECVQYRTNWLRLISCGEKLLKWTHNSSLPPSSLAHALQMSQLDPAINIFYPDLSRTITHTLQHSRIAIDHEFKKKYKELAKIYSSMEAAVKFIKDKECCRSSKTVLSVIKISLPALELHQTESYVRDIGKILLYKLQDWELNDSDWNDARSISLALMACSLQWVRECFYKMLLDSVKSVFSGDNVQIAKNHNLMLLCDVGILTEICCHGLSSKSPEVERSACEIMLYVLRGRLLLTDGSWWRLLASLLPVLPLLHSYAEHDNPLGEAICKSLQMDIADCMGVSNAEVMMGLVRLLFIRCPTVRMESAHTICLLLDDDKYLPPKESLRAEVLINALGRIKPQDFNIDRSSTSDSPQTIGLLQILDVLKQDIQFDENNMGLSESYSNSVSSLEPSMRRSTLQQLSVLMQQQELHEKFLQYDGLKIIVSLLRLSLLVDDYLAFPECALSCVSVLNSVCYSSRHTLAKINDLPAMIIRVILVFPANESVVTMAVQVLSVTAWAGFALQELNRDRKRVLALPRIVVERTDLPFPVQSYWDTSPNTEHSSLEWLVSEDRWRAAIRVRWSYTWNAPLLLVSESPPPPGPLALRVTEEDLASLQAACPLYSTTKCLLALQNATSHGQVNKALYVLESYCRLVKLSSTELSEFAALPWMSTMSRFLNASPASPKDIVLLTTLLKFIITYIQNMPDAAEKKLTEWIMASFLDSSNSMITLLSKDRLFPQQTTQESIEVTQLHIHIVKVLLHCIIISEREEIYDSLKLQSLLKILMACLERVDLKNFHMLGYLNELVKCIRYLCNSRRIALSSEWTVSCMMQVCRVLCGCASGGCKGQACRLDAVLTLLALVTRATDKRYPVQSWGDVWSGEVMQVVVSCEVASRPELRAAALELLALLARYTQLMPHIQQAIPDESLTQKAAATLADPSEANLVRAGAATLLTAITAQPRINELDILDELTKHNFLEHCLEILAAFFNEKKLNSNIEPNVPLSMLERYNELEVRASKGGEVHVSPRAPLRPSRAPPTARLVVELANVIYNVTAYSNCSIKSWNEQGLFRLLFRCTWWGDGSVESARVRESACRALSRVLSSDNSVRASIATTKDCLHSLLYSLIQWMPLPLEDCNEYISGATSQGLLLIGNLLNETSASRSVWSELEDRRGTSFFYLLLQCLRSHKSDLQTSSMFCLNQLTQSMSHRKLKSNSDTSLVDFFDNIKTIPKEELGEDQEAITVNGEENVDNCYPEYISEELCQALILLYRKLSTDDRRTDWSQDVFWLNICSCIASLLCVSPRGRVYAAHRGLHHILMDSLKHIKDHLSMHGKPADVIRNAKSKPALCTLGWILRVINSMMINCNVSKEAFANNYFATYLNCLWPWCMMTGELRDTVTQLLHTFTNGCPKAWSKMSECVSGRCLVTEVCLLVGREAALLSRSHSPNILTLALDTLTHCTEHHHARALMLKSEVLSCVNKLRVVRVSGVAGGGAGAAWARLACAVARHTDGAARVLSLRPLPPAPLSLPALANAAHHHRITFLQAPELLDMLCGALLSADTAHLVYAGRALWALAANNHKAKLALRSSGVSAALRAALERLRRSRKDAATDRALQLLTYTDTVLQVT